MKSSRRRFLQASAILAPIAFAPATLSARPPEFSDEELEVVAARPVLKLDGLKSPVLIESIELLRRAGDFIIRVRSKEGAEGISLDNGRADFLYPIFKELIAPYFIGKDARDLEEHLASVYRHRSNYKLQGIALWSPVAWVELAILDLLGRVAGRSIADLLGGAIRKTVPFYVASGRRDTTAPQEIEHLQGLIAETGAKAVKYRIGGRMSRDQDSLPGRTEQLIPLSRETLGPGIAIHADSNSSYSARKAIDIGRRLEEIDAVYFEEPCPFDHLEETKRVADALTIPVAGGEQEFSQWRFQWMIRNRGVDIVQPDIQYYGGLIRSLRVARMADLREMPTTVHISGGFGFAYMLHFAACARDPGRFQEYKQGVKQYGPWFNPPLRTVNGSLTIPTGPGCGIADIGEVLKDARPI